jgi:phosphatidylglycerophosphate synthase
VDYHTSTFNQAFALALLVCIIATAVVSIGGYLRRPHDLSMVGGSRVLRPGIRGWYFENLRPFEDLFVRWGVHPAYLSCAQLVGSVLVAACYGFGLLFTAGWLLLCTGTFDIIDGRVARRTSSGSRRGAFLDSVVDRFADSTAYLGLVIFFRDSWVVWAVLFAWLGGLMVSYVRARAEGLGAQCTVGLLQRAERYVILGFGTIFGSLVEHITGSWLPAPHYWLIIVTIMVLAVLSNLTVLQRVRHVWRVLGEPSRA